MQRIRHFFRPTLVRRIVGALLLAFAVVWVVLMGFQFWEQVDVRAVDARMPAVSQSFLLELAHIDTVPHARELLDKKIGLIEAAYKDASLPVVFFVRLSDAQGNIVYASPGAQAIPVEPGVVRHVSVAGKEFRIYRAVSGKWDLLIAESVLSNFWILQQMSADLLLKMAIAFPLVLLPIWIAVSTGLRPLRKLSDSIKKRGASDLSPLQIDPRYAELQPLSTALENLLQQLRNKIAREHAFVHDAAHELRTPLAVIAAQAHVLSAAAEPGQRAEAGQHLSQAIARASHLIQQLLQMAQVDSQASYEVRTLDLAQVLRQELATLTPAALQRELELSLETPDALPVSVEVQALQSIIQNLLTNAIRYVQPGGQILVGLAWEDDCIRLSVADNGPGIPEVERKAVFERFYRRAGQDVSGSGLGLAIVQQAVLRLRGSIVLKNGLGGRGCEFVVSLPLPGRDLSMPEQV